MGRTRGQTQKPQKDLAQKRKTKKKRVHSERSSAETVPTKRKRRQVAKQTKQYKKKQVNKKNKALKIVPIIWLIIRSMLLAIIIVTLVFAVFRLRVTTMTTDGMTPVIQAADKVVFDKQARLERYAVVVADVKGDHFSGQVIQRLVGLPGDSIWVDGEMVFINHSVNGEISLAPKIYASQLPAGTMSFIVKSQDVLKELSGMKNIPENQYLLLNEDLEVGNDSRSFGFVNQRRIIGVVVFQI